MVRVSQRFSNVLNALWQQPRSWFGTKRPQVQILAPRPVQQVSDPRECRAPRPISPSPAIETVGKLVTLGTVSARPYRGKVQKQRPHRGMTHRFADERAPKSEE